jgi:hypothetical protein
MQAPPPRIRRHNTQPDMQALDDAFDVPPLMVRSVSEPFPKDKATGDVKMRATSVKLLPRQRFQHNTPIVIDQETLKSRFHMQLPDAARSLGISETALKHVCRKLGINRWPRRLRAFDCNKLGVLRDLSSEDASSSSSAGDVEKQRASTSCGLSGTIEGRRKHDVSSVFAHFDDQTGSNASLLPAGCMSHCGLTAHDWHVPASVEQQSEQSTSCSRSGRVSSGRNSVSKSSFERGTWAILLDPFEAVGFEGEFDDDKPRSGEGVGVKHKRAVVTSCQCFVCMYGEEGEMKH